MVPAGEATASAWVETVVRGVGLAEPFLITREPVTTISAAGAGALLALSAGLAGAEGAAACAKAALEIVRALTPAKRRRDVDCEFISIPPET